jgi:hypothetical protein
MSIVMQDPVRLETQSRSPVRPMVPPDARTAPMRGKVSFELESRGGYRRTVTGTIAYLDDEAQTYMVRGVDGELLRAPIRDIKTTGET